MDETTNACEAQRKTLMSALDNLLMQRENLLDVSRRSGVMCEKNETNRK